MNFGITNALRCYGFKSLMFDSIVPCVVAAVIVLVCMFCSDIDVINILGAVQSLAIPIVPTLSAFVLTAYAFVLSFSSSGIKALESPDGVDLMHSINGGFASSLIIDAFTIVFYIVTICINALKIYSPYASLINYVTLFISVFLLVFVVWILVGIVEDIFNMVQVIIEKNADCC
jgi:hypothetical protein